MDSEYNHQTVPPDLEGPEGVKWELGLAGVCPGKIGFRPSGLGFGH